MNAIRTGKVGLLIGPAFLAVSVLLFVFTAGYHRIATGMVLVGAMNIAVGIMLRARQSPGSPHRPAAP